MRCWLAAWCAFALAAGARDLPVFIEDNHASAFEQIVRTVDPDQPHLLLLVDAHSDASAADHSDIIRTGLRRVSTPEERLQRVREWRKGGELQAYNWIEPLMPQPVSKVWWLGGDAAGVAEARHQLDERVGAEVRRSGRLGDRFEAIGLEGLSQPVDLPVIATIDLDYFAGMEAAVCERRFDRIWNAVLAMKNLRMVSFAISRPWLTDDAEAERLLQLALSRSLAVANCRVHLTPFGIEGPDRSERAKEYYGKRSSPPRFDPTRSSPGLRRFFISHRERIGVEDRRWGGLLDGWIAEQGEWRIVADGMQAETDGILRADASAPPVLRVTSSAGRSSGSVRWAVLLPGSASYNVLPELPVGKTFTDTSAPFIQERMEALPPTGDGSLPPAIWQKLLPAGWGRVRLLAEVELAGGGTARTPAVELRITTGKGFRAGLSEQFGMPYVFGAGFLRQGGETGPDTGVGNDCANFLVYAWRRSGRVLPWCNPAQLRRHLTMIRKDCKPGETVAFEPGAIERGLVVHLGSHVAAVWEDRPPLGALTSEDLVVHHLGGIPELIPLAKLLEKRTAFDLMEMPAFGPVAEIGMAGDVNLSGITREEVLLAAAEFRGLPWVANLEGGVGVAQGRRNYEFAFPAGHLDWLNEAGCVAVSQANNHATDGNLSGTREALAARSIGFTGSGRLEAAVVPWSRPDLAVIAVNFVTPGPPAATAEMDGVLTLPGHAVEVRQAIAKAKETGRAVVVLPHWGREFTPEVSTEQVEWARRFVEWGADAVVGSHPHVTQRTDFYRGRPIVYSLGDFIWPGPRRRSPPLFLQIGSDGSIRIVPAR